MASEQARANAAPTPEIAEEDSPRIKQLVKTLRSAESSRLLQRFKQGDAVNEWMGLAYSEMDGMETPYTLDDIARISGFKKSYLSKMGSVAAAFGPELRGDLRKRLVTFTDLYNAYQLMEKASEASGAIEPMAAVEYILQAKATEDKSPLTEALIMAGIETREERRPWAPPEGLEPMADPFPYMTRPSRRDKGMRFDRKALKAFESTAERARRSLSKICGGILKEQPNASFSIIIDEWYVPHLTGWLNVSDERMKRHMLATLIEFARQSMTSEEFQDSIREIFGEIDETIGQWDIFFKDYDPEAMKRSQIRKLDAEIAALHQHRDQLRREVLDADEECPNLAALMLATSAAIGRSLDSADQ